jgi:hypothetical protein
MLDRAAARGEITPVAQPELISDLLTGPLLLRTVLPAIGAIDDDIIEATVEAALSRCRTPSVAPAGSVAAGRRDPQSGDSRQAGTPTCRRLGDG